MKINESLTPADLLPKVARLWEASAAAIDSIERTCPPGRPRRCSRSAGRYTARGWTEWTQGFQYGSALLQFDATGDERFLDLGRERTRAVMASHVSHIGVHDHGFNNVSTYGNLWRLMSEGRIDDGQRRLLRAGAEGQRRRAGRPVAHHGRRHGLHLLVQRPAVAVRRHDPVLPRAGRRPPARPRADGRARRADQPAAAAGRARGQHRPLQRLLRRGPRRVRRARAAPRTRRSSTSTTAATAARAPSRATRRSAPGPAAWPGRCSASPSSSSSWPRCRRRGPRARTAGEPAVETMLRRAADGDLRLLSGAHADRRRAVLGHRRAGPGPARRLPGLRRPTRSTPTSRSTAPPPRSPRRACCGWATTWARRARGGATGRPG